MKFGIPEELVCALIADDASAGADTTITAATRAPVTA
jgi:hypothetical protein